MKLVSVSYEQSRLNFFRDQLADFVSDNPLYNDQNIECLVARALLHGNKVVINSSW